VVAALTMQRARQNVELLLDLLRTDNYEFAPGADMVVFEPPEARITARLEELEATTGPLPLALRAWYEHVGRVLAEYRDWQADQRTQRDRGAFTIDLAPDYLHKANVSGGPPYSMAVPSLAADGLLLWERHQTTLVNYLRICFRWAAFPGWDRGQLDGWAQPSEPVPAILTHWAAQLLPL
jgi:hypothetical protein